MSVENPPQEQGKSRLVDAYIKWLESLNASGTHRISQFVSRDVRMRTPLADAFGREGAAELYKHWFEDAQLVKTKVRDCVPGADGRTLYIKWERLVTPTRGKPWAMGGVTEIMIGMDGQIASIIDHWDGMPPEPEKGFLRRLLRR